MSLQDHIDASSSPTTPLLNDQEPSSPHHVVDTIPTPNGDSAAAAAAVAVAAAAAATTTTSVTPARRQRSWLTLMLSPLTDETGDSAAVATGLTTLFLVGGTLGAVVLPHDSDLQPAWYRTTSATIGYIYFLAWSVSFYPQVLTNFRRKTTQGLSVDFCLLNVLGFGCYTTYTVALYVSPGMRREYRNRQGHGSGVPVEPNDVAFCVHALVLSIITVGQVVWYGGSVTAAVRQVRPVIGRFMLALLVWIGVVGPVLVLSGVWHDLDYLYSLSFIKVIISLVKYIPQVILNIQRQSTVGWSIWQILLDLTGGCLSDVQLVGDTWAKTPAEASVWKAVVTGNPAKLALGSLSMAFDIVFIIQHYILYPTVTTTIIPPIEEGLIEPGTADDHDDNEADEISSMQALNGGCPADQVPCGVQDEV